MKASAGLAPSPYLLPRGCRSKSDDCGDIDGDNDVTGWVIEGESKQDALESSGDAAGVGEIWGRQGKSTEDMGEGVGAAEGGSRKIRVFIPHHACLRYEKQESDLGWRSLTQL